MHDRLRKSFCGMKPLKTLQNSSCKLMYIYFVFLVQEVKLKVLSMKSTTGSRRVLSFVWRTLLNTIFCVTSSAVVSARDIVSPSHPEHVQGQDNLPLPPRARPGAREPSLPPRARPGAREPSLPFRARPGARERLLPSAYSLTRDSSYPLLSQLTLLLIDLRSLFMLP